MNSYDVIIIGGGTAGCVLASRLSERAATSVLLLEAGRDLPPGREPADVRDPYPLSYYNAAHFWPNLRAYPRRRDNSKEVALNQGRILGGGSSVMGMTALRGTPADYDAWERLGARGWNWDGVLAYFRKLESDADFGGELHGKDGPVPIRRYPRDVWPPLSRAMLAYAQNRQIPLVEDMNADFRDGLSSAPRSSWPDKRASAAFCYLTASVRARPNLRIATEAHVTGLLFEGRRAVGVTVAIDGREQRFAGREIIVSAGALQTPAFLLRAGIGPARELSALGVSVLHDLPGVGKNLHNHAVMYLSAHLRRGMEQSPAIRSHFNTCIRYSSRLPDCPETDLYLSVLNSSSWHALGKRVAAIVPTLMKPASRGQVTLRLADPRAVPLIEWNYLADARDRLRMVRLVRDAIAFLFAPEIRPLWQSAYLIRQPRRMRELNALSRLNAVRSYAVAKVLDIFPSLSARVFSVLSDPDADLERLLADADMLEAQVLAGTAGAAHPVGTCRMGAAGDPAAVVAPDGRVHGLAGLRVADASVMPEIPRGNTNIPTTMVAEKMADAIKLALT